MTNFVTYYRVSTDRQGRSGLGLEGQREAVARHVRESDHVLASFTEVESGRVNARPELARALAECRRTGATLLIAKLDRLARRVSFLSALMDDTGVSFVACDNPNATRLTLHILAAVAEHEAEMVSARTKAALAAAKARGVALGGFKGHVPTPDDRAKGKARQHEEAQRRAASVLPSILGLRAEGITSATALAKALNARGIPTARGGRWQAVQVSRVLALAS
jgi:DNA invertase Pin-like site-specific DNA recombinase